MLKKSMWYSIFTIAVVCSSVLAIGFYQAIMVSPQSTPEAPMTLHLLILGDSVAKGTGDEKGKGFSGYLPEYFKRNTPKEIVVNNAGIDGLESLGLLEQLQSQRLKKQIIDSDIILVSIGGNDVRSILSLNTRSKEDQFNIRLDSYLCNIKLTIKELRKSTPNSIIIFLGLYNPYEKLTSVGDTRNLNTWNYSTQQVVQEDEKAIFIPTHDLLKDNLEGFIAQDGLHPNSAGYQALANRISKSVETIITEF